MNSPSRSVHVCGHISLRPCVSSTSFVFLGGISDVIIGRRDGLRSNSGEEVAERVMLRWTVHLEGGPRRVNHAAVAVGHKVYSFGGYCSGEDYETLRQIDVHVFNTGEVCRMW